MTRCYGLSLLLFWVAGLSIAAPASTPQAATPAAATLGAAMPAAKAPSSVPTQPASPQPTAANAAPKAGEAASLDMMAIVGWPSRPLDHEKPPHWLGDDPVLGRLMCPPLSRLNLSRKKSEPLIYQDVSVNKNAAGKTVWSFAGRTGIYWWSGAEVSPADLASYLKEALPRLVMERGAGLWHLPTFSVLESAQQVSVVWDEAPAFGPYLFNGAAFWRTAASERQKQSGLAYECAGTYQPKLAKQGIHLSPVAAYAMRRPPLLVVNQEEPGALPQGIKRLQFTMAETFAVHPKDRIPSRPQACTNPIDLPLLSVVSWNTQKGMTADPRLRAVLTTITPRGALLRAGAGHAGDLLSSFFPRNHPGANTRVLVRPFSLSDGGRALDGLGLKRPQGDQDRLDTQAKPIYLKLASVGEKTGLVEKVLSDSLMAVGIHAQFMPRETPAAGLDGVVSGIFLPWPSMSLLGHFHSTASDHFPFWHLNDKGLDRDLEAYALTVTEQFPDFQPLQRVHASLFQLEPATVLMQHRACLQVAGAPATPLHIDVRDPDWFRRLVL